jgi:hypothetical protein
MSSPPGTIPTTRQQDGSDPRKVVMVSQIKTQKSVTSHGWLGGLKWNAIGSFQQDSAVSGGFPKVGQLSAMKVSVSPRKKLTNHPTEAPISTSITLMLISFGF